jgi:hypothetical protein
MADLNPPAAIVPVASVRAPRVFLSCSHDSPKHQDRVLALANRLRQWGIDATVDQFDGSPREGWPMWTEREIRQSDFVLVVCTETYLTRVERREGPGRGRGVVWEAPRPPPEVCRVHQWPSERC